MDILVLGGDKRSVYAARELEKRHSVTIYALGEYSEIPDKKFDCAVLGLPCSRDGENIHAPMFDEKIPIKSVPRFVKSGGIVAGGMIKPVLRAVCRENHIFCEDYYDDETVILKNAVPSAEGALAAGIYGTAGQIMGMRVLVTGYGRIASLLARYLTALGAKVTIAARSAEKRALAEVNGCAAVDFTELKNIIDRFALIYNTVPAAVLHDEEISRISSDAVYIELASASGLDRFAAQHYNVNIINAQGLPSKTAPAAAGEIIADAVQRILNKYSN